MATSKIMTDSTHEILASGVDLYRIGKIRILNFTNYVLGTPFTIPVADRPPQKAVGIGTRDNGSAFITFVRIEINTNGNATYYLAGTYNTGNGYSLGVANDVYSANVVWSVA